MKQGAIIQHSTVDDDEAGFQVKLSEISAFRIDSGLFQESNSAFLLDNELLMKTGVMLLKSSTGENAAKSRDPTSTD